MQVADLGVDMKMCANCGLDVTGSRAANPLAKYCCEACAGHAKHKRMIADPKRVARKVHVRRIWASRNCDRRCREHREWRERNRAYRLAYDRERNRLSRHSCLDCDRLVDRGARRCRPCAAKARWRSAKP